ncbi:melanocortin-2 receptor accessory protein 2A [Silurus asotus]|uniref:Melanocortin-2 receptor accessory protein 2A n=1 Tax=Silurus asotus TaxID=30991 RepID=A0AAD4ZYQ0_SILAS|nr:melanocortin-2 receptor accessory protein 2A [Silurus asotus]
MFWEKQRLTSWDLDFVTGQDVLWRDPDDSEYEDVTGDDINYMDYIDYNETDYENTTFVDYKLYATPKKGIRNNQEQSISEKDGAVNYGTNQINDKLEMPVLQHLNTTAGASHTDYEWRYEYYDDEEPISFEGLKAHKYSIVIGFWVGLAVFVIFMFFVLTLLTKTGAPHPESSEPCEDCVHLTSCVEELGRPRDPENTRAGLPQSLLEESRFLFNCYINEEEQAGEPTLSRARRAHTRSNSNELSGLVKTSGVIGKNTQLDMMEDNEADFLAHFNIPNFVNSELSSTLGEDDLLLTEPPIIMESESRSHSTSHIRD